ncbi:hypothetical protein CJU90_5184 [Yarrowia sp. C11]|nr:hypothetical protein CJU90_5184 [Yarrowia sp. C11]
MGKDDNDDKKGFLGSLWSNDDKPGQSDHQSIDNFFEQCKKHLDQIHSHTTSMADYTKDLTNQIPNIGAEWEKAKDTDWTGWLKRLPPWNDPQLRRDIQEAGPGHGDLWSTILTTLNNRDDVYKDLIPQTPVLARYFNGYRVLDRLVNTNPNLAGAIPTKEMNEECADVGGTGAWDVGGVWRCLFMKKQDPQHSQNEKMFLKYDDFIDWRKQMIDQIREKEVASDKERREKMRAARTQWEEDRKSKMITEKEAKDQGLTVTRHSHQTEMFYDHSSREWVKQDTIRKFYNNGTESEIVKESRDPIGK